MSRDAATASSASRPRKRGPRAIAEIYARLDDLGGIRRGGFAVLAAASLAGGFVEAALIALVLRTALALSTGDSAFVIAGGPLNVSVSAGSAFLTCGGLIIVSFGLSWCNAAITARLATRAVDHARSLAMAAFMASRWEIQSLARPARLQELLSGHVSRLGQSAVVLSTGLNAALSFLAFLLSAILITPLAAVVMLFGVLIFGLGVLPLTRVTRRRSAMQAQLNVQYTQAVNQSVSLAREARIFNVEESVRLQLAEMAAENARVGYAVRFLARMTPVVYQLVALSLLVGGLAASFAFSLGDVASLGVMVVLLVRSISYGQQINTAVQQSSEVSPYLDELLAQIDLYHAHPVTSGTRPTPSVARLEMRGVQLSYEPGRPVLSDISFTVERGETVGIVGPSGGGKSSLLQVLVQLRKPEMGRYLLNGDPVEEFDLRSWFEQVSLVPQDNFLLPGTVADNIRFYRDRLAAADIERAARLAHLHDDVLALPDGYDTRVGPGAGDLSGGQKQRLGLARALAGRPSVLMLDEATSALDMRSEALIQETLADLKGTMTCFIVAHRLTTLSSCDRVMVLEGGRISAFGSASQVHGMNAFFADATSLSRGEQ